MGKQERKVVRFALLLTLDVDGVCGLANSGSPPFLVPTTSAPTDQLIVSTDMMLAMLPH